MCWTSGSGSWAISRADTGGSSVLWIGDQTPASLWLLSPRAYPERITPAAYPAHMEIRRVSTAGTFRLHAKQPFLSHVLGLSRALLKFSGGSDDILRDVLR